MPPKSTPPAKPNWRTWKQLNPKQRHDALIHKKWLLETGSLTEKLSARCGGRVRVEVLSQKIGYPFREESRAIGIPTSGQALIREVLLWADREPAFFARTVIPLKSFNGPLRHLRKWDSRSIGSYLFANPRLHRGQIEIAYGDLQQFGTWRSGAENIPLWGRRSCFSLYNKRLLVSEFFLPNLR